MNLGLGMKKNQKIHRRKVVNNPTYFKTTKGGSVTGEKLLNKGAQIWDESNKLHTNINDLKLEDVKEFDLKKETKIGFGISLGSLIPISFDFGKRSKEERSVLHGTISKTTEESREKKKTKESTFRLFTPLVDVKQLVSDVKTIKQAVSHCFQPSEQLTQEEIKEVLEDKDVVKVLEALEVVQQEVEKSPSSSPRPLKRPVLSEGEIRLNTGDEILDRNVPEVIGTESISVIALESALNELEKSSSNKSGNIALATQQIIAGTKAVLQDIKENPGEYAKDIGVGLIPFGEQGEKLIRGEKITGSELLMETALTFLPMGKIGNVIKKSSGRAAKVFMKAMVKTEKVMPTTNLSKQLRSCIKDLELKSGLKTTEKQRTLLANTLRQNKFKKLGEMEKKVHTDKYTKSKKLELMKEWERNTGQKWPESMQFNSKSGLTEPTLHQAHHIIPQQFKGPHEWWNIHPVAQPKHQGGVHGKGSILNEIVKDLKK